MAVDRHRVHPQSRREVELEGAVFKKTINESVGLYREEHPRFVLEPRKSGDLNWSAAAIELAESGLSGVDAVMIERHEMCLYNYNAQ
ncbi:hypothetical protein PROFUN_14958 [Planoprotostelium fungivorum]|uniref:Uncharacterized protein n=1 Tax=Planoprotostelium fungivorum TaxID=1890364 RepID=A0A2P6MY95_9EUKA|nr:hypothetical protein PROFUN_14958 [Planoprotostelium fungivorum]